MDFVNKKQNSMLWESLLDILKPRFKGDVNTVSGNPPKTAMFRVEQLTAEGRSNVSKWFKRLQSTDDFDFVDPPEEIVNYDLHVIV